eukprot:COSAG01_NODE_3777_length_5704_cov_34.622658_3_plen_45_part_00
MVSGNGSHPSANASKLPLQHACHKGALVDARVKLKIGKDARDQR